MQGLVDVFDPEVTEFSYDFMKHTSKAVWLHLDELRELANLSVEDWEADVTVVDCSDVCVTMSDRDPDLSQSRFPLVLKIKGCPCKFCVSPHPTSRPF